jgi:hypothetical protein
LPTQSGGDGNSSARFRLPPECALPSFFDLLLLATGLLVAAGVSFFLSGVVSAAFPVLLWLRDFLAAGFSSAALAP